MTENCHSHSHKTQYFGCHPDMVNHQPTGSHMINYPTNFNNNNVQDRERRAAVREGSEIQEILNPHALSNSIHGDLSQLPFSQPPVSVRTLSHDDSMSRRHVASQDSLLMPNDRSSAGQSSSTYSSNELIYEKGRLVSGTLDALICHLTPTSSYMPERTYVFAFLLCSRLIIKPPLLLADVCKRCLLEQGLARVGADRKTLGRLGDHVIGLARHWIALFPQDFRDERMMRLLKDLLDRVSQAYPDLVTVSNKVKSHLAHRLSEQAEYERLLAHVDAAPSKSLLNLVRTTDVRLLCPSATVLAQQLTHIELDRYKRIGAQEFIYAFNASHQSSTPSQSTKSLDAYVHWFNRLSYLVGTEVCIQLKRKWRSRTIEYFIDVAKDCFNIGNFNSFMAIVAGLNLSSVARLKKTWDKVEVAKLKVLEQHVSPSNNFAAYRSTLKAALWRSESATYQRERIVVPFFSLLVKDLHFLHESCSTRLPGTRLVNFEKFWHISKQLMEIFAWKQVDCPFEAVPTVQHYLLTCPVYTDDSMTLASYGCEPPDNQYEKNKYKELKSSGLNNSL